MTVFTLTFDGFASPGNNPAPIPDGYNHFIFEDMAAHYVTAADQHPTTGNGYGNALVSGDSVGFTFNDGGGFVVDGLYRFTLTQMTVAAAWDDHLRVTFRPERHPDDPVVRGFTVTLDQEARTIHFPKRFTDLRAIAIDVRGGHDANPNDAGSGRNVALENVVVNLVSLADAHHHGARSHHDMLDDQMEAALHPAAAIARGQPLGLLHDLGVAPHVTDLHAFTHWMIA